MTDAQCDELGPHVAAALNRQAYGGRTDWEYDTESRFFLSISLPADVLSWDHAFRVAGTKEPSHDSDKPA